MASRKRLDHRLFNADDPSTQPPEELRALCAMCDVRVEFVHGQTARAWRLSVGHKFRGAPVPNPIILQSTQYEDWNEAVKKLLA